MIKICLFEDDETMRSLLKTLLEIEGYQVLATNPEEDAISILIREKPNLLILDVHLKYCDGVDILKSIRETEETKSLVVLMTSGMDLEDICLNSGANGFLLKPYMPDDLINWIKINTTQSYN